jgi:hypothetical protein
MSALFTSVSSFGHWQKCQARKKLNISMVAILARQKQKNLLKISLSCRGIRAMLFRQEQKLIQTETHFHAQIKGIG